jgi:hypothetical protein
MMKKLLPLLGLLALCLLPRAAHATYCGAPVTWLNNSPTTTVFGANLVSTTNFGCNALVGSTGQALFPDPAALKDALANPTTILFGALLQGFNGTTWDRLLDDANKILEVDCSANCGLADEASFTAGTTVGSPIMGYYQTTETSNPCTNGQTCAVGITINRALKVQLSGTTGVPMGTAANPVINQPASPYPATAVPITASATGTTGATTATLTNVTGHTTYICGFSIRANATAAATGNATVTGTITGTLNYTQWTAPNASGLGVTEQIFTPCVPASAVSTSIAVISAAPGTGGVVSVTAWGYSI